MTQEILRTEIWTYLGAEFSGRERKLYHIYEDPRGERQSYARALTRQSPGAMFTMTLTEKDTVYYKGQYSPAYQGMMEDTERRILLEAQHRAALAEARNVKRAKADMSHSALEEALRPLSKEYGRRTSVGRVAFIAAIIEIVTRR